MKSKEAVSKRLRNLRLRYAKQHVKASQARCHRNCRFNHEQQALTPLQYSKNAGPDIEFERAPRRSSTLVVIQDPPSSIRVCTFGMEDPESWNGDLCDSDDISKSCTKFKPKVEESEAREEFMQLLADDDYVYEHFRDIAALQWVLDERLKDKPLSLWERISLRVSGVLGRTPRASKALPPPELPAEGLWENEEAD